MTGIGLAILACIIWSGNFIIARQVIHDIPPISLAFFRWATASLIMIPIGAKALRQDWPVLKANPGYFFWTALSGITIFNTLVYVAGHYTPAINLALIGTTSSPVIAIFLARIFLKEKITSQRVTGLVLCITGIIYLLAKGSLEKLLTLQFGVGDAWILAAAFAFAIYSVMVRKKPAGMDAKAFLLAVFVLGTLMLLPAYGWESMHTAPIVWTPYLAGVVIYLGLGTSVISFLCWNYAISRLGAARTTIFGNLIPLFSSLEAVWILNEKITHIHLVSGLLVIGGLVIANLTLRKG
jgi:drug/metabolite transporter (DMT)-like permease